jgi:small conductance mechanosensitive channel
MPGVENAGWLLALAVVVVVALLGTLVIVRASARDLVRGCALLLGEQLRVGDYVEVAGYAGVVEGVGLRAVRLRDDDGAVHFVRTGVIDTVTNRSFGRAWAVVDVPAAEADLERTVRCLREAAAELRSRPGNALRVLDDVEIAGLERWERGGVQLRARIAVAPGQQASVRRELLAAYQRHLSGPTVAGAHVAGGVVDRSGGAQRGAAPRVTETRGHGDEPVGR